MGIEVHLHGTYDSDEAGLIEEMQPILRRAHGSLTRRIATQARADVPVKTGKLGRSIAEDEAVFVDPLHIAGGVSAGGPGVEYAVFVHEGTRPHLILPKRPGGVLAFNVGGRTVFAKSVHHPGTRSRPFLRNAAERVAAEGE